MNSQFAKLEAEIVSTIKNVPASILTGRGDGEWTVTIKRALISLGVKNGYNVCAAGFPDECEREWLYDLVWYRNDPPEHLREIGLVVESEWAKNVHAVKYDFEKLLVAKSPIKVMVFQDFKDSSIEQMWSLLEKGIHTFKAEAAGEKYLLAGFNNADYEFQIKPILA